MNRPLTGIRADWKEGYSSIEMSAANLRQRLRLGRLDRFDAWTFFNHVLPTFTIECGAGSVSLCEAVEECEQEGLTRWNPNSRMLELVLSGSTYDSLRRGQPRARYTVAHECGHVSLHADQIISMRGMSLVSQIAFHRDRKQHQACEDTEWQANAFASALLMPADGVLALRMRHGALDEYVVAETFDVSLESACYRLGTYEKSLGRK